MHLLMQKRNEVKDKILNITNLDATPALTVVEKKTPNINNLVKITDYNSKISEIRNKIITNHDFKKYITPHEFDKLTFQNLYCKIKTNKLALKSDIANFAKKKTKKKIDNKLKDVTSNK